MIKRKLVAYNFENGSMELREDILELECNRCKKIMTKDDMEFYDTLHWENVAGYGSIFEDGTVMSLTLCPCCVKDIADAYIIRS